VPEALPASFSSELAGLKAEMQEALATADRGKRVREGFRVAIMGPANAGKSSLLNALAREAVAIVTDEPGTTRDVLEVPLNLNGHSVIVHDTAGLRDSLSVAEQEGVRRARSAGDAADLILWVEDCRAPPTPPPIVNAPVWRILNKTDLGPAARAHDFAISVVTGAGVAELIESLGDAASGGQRPEPALVTQERQRAAIADAVAALSLAAVGKDEISADLLREAGEAISRLTGRIDVEDVLERLFAGFCIGK
jgi:tRNA modification GTPase